MPHSKRPFAMYFPDEEDEDPPFCDDCGQPMEADADVDDDPDTGRPYISGWTAICTNRNCPEPPDS